MKAAAEAMAREELGHIAAVRKERRKAYHRERDHVRRVPGPDEAFHSPDAARLERRLSSLLAAQADRLAGAAAAQAIAEALVDAYLEAAELSRDPLRLDLLQALAGQVIARLAWIRTLC